MINDKQLEKLSHFSNCFNKLVNDLDFLLGVRDASLGLRGKKGCILKDPFTNDDRFEGILDEMESDMSYLMESVDLFNRTIASSKTDNIKLRSFSFKLKKIINEYDN